LFDKFLICEDSLSNTVVDGRPVGYAFDVRIGYYRGVRLSLIEEIEVFVDGEEVPREGRRFTVKGQTHTFDEMETITHERWEMGERATLSVERDGGLRPGNHSVEVRELIRISYGTGYTRASDRKELALNG